LVLNIYLHLVINVGLTCGGVHDVFIKDGYVVVEADEDRDNKIKVTYTVLDSSVSKNGLPMKEPNAFITK
jgi:hypothetical protein